MSWFDSVLSAAETAAQRVKNFTDDIFPDFSKVSAGAAVSNPVVLLVKGSDALMQGVVAASSDFNIKRAGYEAFAKLPADYIAPDEQYSRDVQSHNVADLVSNYAKATAGNVADGVKAVVDAVTPDPGSMPLWVKFTVAGAVLVGSAVMIQSLMQGGRRAA